MSGKSLKLDAKNELLTPVEFEHQAQLVMEEVKPIFINHVLNVPRTLISLAYGKYQMNMGYHYVSYFTSKDHFVASDDHEVGVNPLVACKPEIKCVCGHIAALIGAFNRRYWPHYVLFLDLATYWPDKRLIKFMWGAYHLDGSMSRLTRHRTTYRTKACKRVLVHVDRCLVICVDIGVVRWAEFSELKRDRHYSGYVLVVDEDHSYKMSDDHFKVLWFKQEEYKLGLG